MARHDVNHFWFSSNCAEKWETTRTVLKWKGRKVGQFAEEKQTQWDSDVGHEPGRRAQMLGNSRANNVSNNKDAIKAIKTWQKNPYGNSDRKVNVFVLQRHKCTWAFSDCGETFPVERGRMCLPPRKGSGIPEGTQCRTWRFSESRDSYRLGFVCITLVLIIVWHSLFATFCLCRRGRASGC